MSPISSISSSEGGGYRGYLLRMAAVVAVLIAVAVALAAYGVLNQSIIWNDTQLLRYQTEKLQKAKDVKILLVGDSSLGNAVNARAWTKALHQPVLSLPLTGLYGFGGSLNMIRRAVRNQPIRTVIVFQQAGMLNQKVRPEGALLTAERWSDLELVTLPVAWSWFANLAVSFNVVGTLVTGRQDRTAMFTALDYSAQGAALPEIGPKPDMDSFDTANIKSEHEVFLVRIGRLCEDWHIHCLYVHGPISDAVCKGSVGYVEEVNRRVRAAGLIPVAHSPICLPWQHTGDTVNHVRPQFKAAYSARYFELVRPYIMPETLNVPP